jgi:hypothetical protein
MLQSQPPLTDGAAFPVLPQVLIAGLREFPESRSLKQKVYQFLQVLDIKVLQVELLAPWHTELTDAAVYRAGGLRVGGRHSRAIKNIRWQYFHSRVIWEGSWVIWARAG